MIISVEVGEWPEKINGRYTPQSDRRSRMKYHERPFVAWDGEGCTHLLGRAQSYILFGASTGDEVSSKSLNSWQCLSLIIKVGIANPDAIHVGFSITYDLNMIVRDFSRYQLNQLKKLGKTKFYDWVVEWLPNKWIRVYDVRKKISVKIYDVFTFFACAFVSKDGKKPGALEQYLGWDHPELVKIREGKAGRNTFKYSELDTIIRPYMQMELKLLVLLMEKLRSYLETVGIRPREWYGPGAVATALLKSNGVGKSIVRDLDDGVIEASQYAYFGGRFEQFFTGRYDGDVYSYDICSAYPHALRLAPNLANGEWVHSYSVNEVRPFSLYRIEYNYAGKEAGYHLLPQPFPYRDKRHAVHYPSHVKGWYWGTELLAALKYYNVLIHEAWEFIPNDVNDKPFAFVDELYLKRMQWKAESNPVQLAAKLGLNSMYGKLAQRIGWDEENFKPPRWHQLEYAGFATATCRSLIFDAIMQNPLSIIAVETDGLFSRAPLKLPEGRMLGEWEREHYEGIVYVQSGVYWTRRNDEWIGAKVRGFGPGSVKVDDALKVLKTLEPVRGITRRFASLTGYLGTNDWLKWLVKDHIAAWGGGGKRQHSKKFCRLCQGGNEQMHNLSITLPFGGESHKHVLPWKDAEQNLYQEMADFHAYSNSAIEVPTH